MNKIIDILRILVVILVVSTIHLVTAEIVRSYDSFLFSLLAGMLFWGTIMIFFDFKKWIFANWLAQEVNCVNHAEGDEK